MAGYMNELVKDKPCDRLDHLMIVVCWLSLGLVSGAFFIDTIKSCPECPKCEQVQVAPADGVGGSAGQSSDDLVFGMNGADVFNLWRERSIACFNRGDDQRIVIRFEEPSGSIRISCAKATGDEGACMPVKSKDGEVVGLLCD